jgi:hypothetical protein
MSFNHPDAVIYRLKCLDAKTYYIGSTVNLRTRINNHKCNFETMSKSIIQGGNYKIKILEKCPCNVLIELRQKEQRYLERYREKYGELVLNTNNAYITDEDVRIYKNEYKRQWRKNNPEKQELINAKLRNSAKYKCVCGAILKLSNRTDHLRKSNQHKDYISKINENKI